MSETVKYVVGVKSFEGRITAGKIYKALHTDPDTYPGPACLIEDDGGYKQYWTEKYVMPVCIDTDKAIERFRSELIVTRSRATTLPVGSAERKDYPIFRGPLRYFPAALAEVAKVCKIGNDKHNPGEEMHHARGKSTDHADCILRHMMDMDQDYGNGIGRDENGVPQVTYIAWRALALAQEWLEKHDGAPLAPGAKLP